MTDRPPPERTAPTDPADGEVLSAYLAGELDEAAAAALEERLSGDPELARRLDATAAVLVALRGVDEVALPPGAGKRLRDRLAAPQAAEGRTAHPEAADEEAGTTVTPLASRRRLPWSAIGGVAAGLAAIALIGGGLLQGFGTSEESVGDRPASGTAEDEAVPEALEAPAREEAETEALDRGDGGADGEEQADVSAPEAAPRARADGPVVLDEEVALADEREVRSRYQRLPEVVGLLGEPAAIAPDRAAAYRSAVADAPAFRSGTRPGDCLDDTVGADAVIPVRVESVVHDGRPAVAFVLVSAGEGSSSLDRVEARIVDPVGCAPRLTVDLS